MDTIGVAVLKEILLLEWINSVMSDEVTYSKVKRMVLNQVVESRPCTTTAVITDPSTDDSTVRSKTMLGLFKHPVIEPQSSLV